VFSVAIGGQAVNGALSAGGGMVRVEFGAAVSCDVIVRSPLVARQNPLIKLRVRAGYDAAASCDLTSWVAPDGTVPLRFEVTPPGP
jgi:hypothetical protein